MKLSGTKEGPMSKEQARTNLKASLAKQLSKQLFNYDSLNCQLLPELKGIECEFKSPIGHEDFPLDHQHLKDFQSLVTWIEDHPEVKVFTLSFEANYQSFYADQLNSYQDDSLDKLFQDWRDIAKRMMNLPQAIVFNIKSGLEGPMAELALASDIRVSFRDCEMSFNHHQCGVSPTSLGVELLHHLVGPSRARDWLFTGKSVSPYELQQCGIISLMLDHPDDLTSYLKKMSTASSKARQQTKRVLFEMLQPHHWPSYIQMELETLDSGDLEEAKLASSEQRSPDFHSLNHVSKSSKRSRDKARSERVAVSHD
jgi:enoyl-CoA hydratase/carnithine racemase